MLTIDKKPGLLRSRVNSPQKRWIYQINLVTNSQCQVSICTLQPFLVGFSRELKCEPSFAKNYFKVEGWFMEQCLWCQLINISLLRLPVDGQRVCESNWHFLTVPRVDLLLWVMENVVFEFVCLCSRSPGHLGSGMLRYSEILSPRLWAILLRFNLFAEEERLACRLIVRMSVSRRYV